MGCNGKPLFPAWIWKDMKYPPEWSPVECIGAMNSAPFELGISWDMPQLGNTTGLLRIGDQNMNAPWCAPFRTDGLVMLRANTSFCPRLSAAIFVCAENVVKMGVFCIMANFMLYIGTHSIGTCASLLHIIIIIPLLKIFNECRSLTGVGELSPYWRSSMNVEV